MLNSKVILNRLFEASIVDLFNFLKNCSNNSNEDNSDHVIDRRTEIFLIHGVKYKMYKIFKNKIY